MLYVFLFSNSLSLPTPVSYFQDLSIMFFRSSLLLSEEIRSLFQMLEYIKISDMVSGFQKLVVTHSDEAGM